MKCLATPRDCIALSAAMQATLHHPVPSSALLRFLKSQSESVYFFSQNPRPGFKFERLAPKRSHPRPRGPRASSKSDARCLSPAVPQRAILEAGFLNLDFLAPRSTFSPLSTRTAQPRGKWMKAGQPLVSQRLSSTGSKGWWKWRKRLWGTSAKKGGIPLEPDDLPFSLYGSEEGGDTSMFSLGRYISAKAAAQPKLRCTEFDEHGNVVLASGEFKKSELIAKVQLSRTFLLYSTTNFLYSMDCFRGIFERLIRVSFHISLFAHLQS